MKIRTAAAASLCDHHPWRPVVIVRLGEDSQPVHPRHRIATRVSGVVLMLALFHAGTTPAAARHEAGSDEERVIKIRSEILKRGVGHEAMVKVRLADGTNVKGFVDRAGASDFVVTDGNGAERTIVYGDVSRLNGPGLPLAAKITIGIGVGVGVFLAWAYIEFRHGLLNGGF